MGIRIMMRSTSAVAATDPALIPEPIDHGGDVRRVAHSVGVEPSDLIDLSASLNPVAPDVTRLAAAHLGALVAYPDPMAATTALAAALQVDPERLVLTNGGAEAIALVAAELGEGWVVEPEFSLYRRHL